MIRFGLLGGRWGPAPWQFFVALGGSSLVAAALFVVLYRDWGTERWLGGTEVVILLAVAITLLALGLRRRRRAVRRV